jgi:hypothetical protein
MASVRHRGGRSRPTYWLELNFVANKLLDQANNRRFYSRKAASAVDRQAHNLLHSGEAQEARQKYLVATYGAF